MRSYPGPPSSDAPTDRAKRDPSSPTAGGGGGDAGVATPQRERLDADLLEVRDLERAVRPSRRAGGDRCDFRGERIARDAMEMDGDWRRPAADFGGAAAPSSSAARATGPTTGATPVLGKLRFELSPRLQQPPTAASTEVKHAERRGS